MEPVCLALEPILFPRPSAASILVIMDRFHYKNKLLVFESPLDCKEIHSVHSEGDQPWDFFGRNDAEAETPVLWPPQVKSWLIGKDSDAEEGLGAGGEGDDRGWDGWMASRTRWMWVCVNSGSWWWTGRPGVLQFMGSQRVGMTEWLNWAELKIS